MEQENIVKEVSLPIFQAKGWLKLLGVFMIIYGIFAAITIIGIIIAWLPIWLGVLLFQAAGAAEGAQLNGDKDTLVRSLSKIKLFFVIQGILLLIGIIVLIISLIISGGALFSIMQSGM